MKQIDQYKSMFSQVHTNVTIQLEDYKNMKRTRSFKKTAILAMMIGLGLASFGTAYAMNLFGLKDMVLEKEEIYIHTPTEDGEEVEMLVPVDIISLQGYKDSNEYKAAKEWNAFRNNYDPDGKLMPETEDTPTGLDEKYSPYFLYTQEMADKLDEITTKYGLTLHSKEKDFNNNKKLFKLAGTKDFLSKENNVVWGYFYEDGTFQYDGYATLDSGKSFDYQLRNCQKGVFDEVFLNIGNEEDYEIWNYKTASGITVTLATSPNKSLLTANLKNSFLNVNILHDFYLGGDYISNVEITPSDLEDFADSIDFSLIR